MHTLRELGEFVGLGNATPPRPDGGVTSARQIGTASIAKNLPSLSDPQRSSLRAMMDGVQALPPISLEAESVGDTSGEVPPTFTISILVHPGNGNIVSTVLNVFESGVLTLPEQVFLPNAEGALGAFVSRHGLFDCRVTRTGVTSAGVAVLEKRFSFAVRDKPVPPPHLPKIVDPVIQVKSTGEGKFLVSGKLFLASASVTIRVAANDLSNLFLTVTSLPDGTFSDFPTGKICTGHGLHELTFSAEDGRIDPSNHQAIRSNFVKLSCPFIP